MIYSTLQTEWEMQHVPNIDHWYSNVLGSKPKLEHDPCSIPIIKWSQVLFKISRSDPSSFWDRSKSTISFAVSNFYTKKWYLYAFISNSGSGFGPRFFFVSTGWEEFDNKEKIEDFLKLWFGVGCVRFGLVWRSESA